MSPFHFCVCYTDIVGLFVAILFAAVVPFVSFTPLNPHLHHFYAIHVLHIILYHFLTLRHFILLFDIDTLKIKQIKLPNIW